MQRDALKMLCEWKTRPDRVPLIVRGARQVGKSWLVRHFGTSFDSFLEINFEKNKSLKAAFHGDIDVARLIERLALYLGKPIKAGLTLLFLDEIQECVEAIQYLRYFKEEFPDLHVVAAGSLLDFALEQTGLPVGRVEFLYLTPLSFGEFLTVNGRDDLRAFLLKQESDPLVEGAVAELLHTYIWLGGMPEVVANWLQYRDPHQCQGLQDRLLTAYRADFHKYAKQRQIGHLDKVLESIPAQIGQKFSYVTVDRDVRAHILREALLCLEKAGIVHICYHTSSQQPPLGAGIDRRRFKVFFFDIGLCQHMLGMTYSDWILNQIKVENLGALAEQLVAQELIAYSHQSTKTELFYWSREEKNSNAEVDFITTRNSSLVPIEVKAGIKGRMRSLRIYLDSHPHASYGLKIAEGTFAQQQDLVEIPFYGIEGWIKAAFLTPGGRA